MAKRDARDSRRKGREVKSDARSRLTIHALGSTLAKIELHMLPSARSRPVSLRPEIRMSVPAMSAPDIDPETSLTLKEAATRFFPDGTVTVRTLRTERDKGKLETWFIGKREYTSLAAIREMLDLCRTTPKVRASTSVSERGANLPMSASTEVPKPQPGAGLRSLQMLKERMHQKKQAKAANPPVSPSTEDANMALALARASAKRLRERSRSTSQKPGSKQSGKAIRRKSGGEGDR